MKRWCSEVATSCYRSVEDFQQSDSAQQNHEVNPPASFRPLVGMTTQDGVQDDVAQQSQETDRVSFSSLHSALASDAGQTVTSSSSTCLSLSRHNILPSFSYHRTLSVGDGSGIVFPFSRNPLLDCSFSDNSTCSTVYSLGINSALEHSLSRDRLCSVKNVTGENGCMGEASGLGKNITLTDGNGGSEINCGASTSQVTDTIRGSELSKIISSRPSGSTQDIRTGSCSCGSGGPVYGQSRMNSQLYGCSRRLGSSSPPPVVLAPTHCFFSQPFEPNSPLPSTSNGGGCLSCGHLCSSCRMHVNMEVDGMSGNDICPSHAHFTSLQSLSFPKRVRHKFMASSKDTSTVPKKKKSPWSFRFHSRSKQSKSEGIGGSLCTPIHGTASGEHGVSGCSCYKKRNSTQPHYSCHMSLYSPHETLNRAGSPVLLSSSRISGFDLGRCFSDDSEETNINSSRDVPENSDAGLLYDFRDQDACFASRNQNSLSFTLNSMLDLQLLLERSLCFGFPPRSVSELPEESFFHQVGVVTPDGSILQRTVHTQIDYIHCLVPDLLGITNCSFYWGKMDRYEAERLLDGKPEGTFLLRDSAQEEYLFSVSFRRYGRSLHARIEQSNHKFSFDSHDPGVFASDTVCGLIEHYKDPSCCMFFEPMLTNPLLRTFPFSLEHLCRSVICSSITYDGINRLRLPKPLKNFLKEYHYKQKIRTRKLEH